MRDRHSVTVVAVIVLAVLFAGPGAGRPPADSSTDSASPSRTTWGHPDLQGMWVNNSATPIERPEEFAGKTDSERRRTGGSQEESRRGARWRRRFLRR